MNHYLIAIDVEDAAFDDEHDDSFKLFTVTVVKDLMLKHTFHAVSELRKQIHIHETTLSPPLSGW